MSGQLLFHVQLPLLQNPLSTKSKFHVEEDGAGDRHVLMKERLNQMFLPSLFLSLCCVVLVPASVSVFHWLGVAAHLPAALLSGECRSFILVFTVFLHLFTPFLSASFIPFFLLSPFHLSFSTHITLSTLPVVSLSSFSQSENYKHFKQFRKKCFIGKSISTFCPSLYLHLTLQSLSGQIG